jgi:acyl carrier protein
VSVVTLDIALEAVNDVLQSRGVTITPDTAFEELGLDSLDLAELMVALEERVGVELDPASAENVKVVRDLVMLEPVAEGVA